MLQENVENIPIVHLSCKLFEEMIYDIKRIKRSRKAPFYALNRTNVAKNNLNQELLLDLFILSRRTRVTFIVKSMKRKS
ncbi:MAG TPA: hypothetical protein PK079_17110 [Leptospiraceae bacterium]|nr:hypothetical protein [Leptospiraceae bacterium]HMX31662.1 hypothetical protein [Leptospiraceae bacterium]HMZ67045.1 hypothetical protein [Leptospiraceae bacterium]HNE54895.1 hypothetical protein [Leptospiraceae bacterium]HNL74358.1 hypothetical protein [Leptospiraceae bacterium]